MANTLIWIRLFTASALLISFSGAVAMWVKMSDQELANSSSIIVKGTMIGASEISLGQDSRALRIGAIQVEHTYKGAPQDVVYIALPSLHGPISSIDIDYPKGKYGIWFLRDSKAGAGIYLADSPQRFWPANESEERIKTLFP